MQTQVGISVGETQLPPSPQSKFTHGLRAKTMFTISVKIL